MLCTPFINIFGNIKTAIQTRMEMNPVKSFLNASAVLEVPEDSLSVSSIITFSLHKYMTQIIKSPTTSVSISSFPHCFTFIIKFLAI